MRLITRCSPAFFGLFLLSFFRRIAATRVLLDQRILQAIHLLEKSVTEPTESTNEALAILYSVKEDLREDGLERRLEDGMDYDVDDDYISWYKIYRQRDDVSVTYDDEDYTVVTVDEDVIVVIDYGIGHYIFNGMMASACIIMGALMAGLLMGVMTLDPLILAVKARTADSKTERRRVNALMPFVQNKNLVLVSVLLVNCGVNEALPMFLDELLPNPVLTIIISVTFVVMFGEIMPSAYFTGRDQIRSASRLIPLLRLVIVITAPVSYPIAYAMDKYFHQSDERAAFKRGELRALVRIQYEEQLAWKRREADALRKSRRPASPAPDFPICNCNVLEPLECIMNDPKEIAMCVDTIESQEELNPEIGHDDMNKLEGALSLKDKRVKQAYMPMNRVVSVSADTVLDEEKVAQLYSHGYSRMPVFETDEDGNSGICGIMLTKQLMLVRKEDNRRVSTLTLYEPPCVSPDTSMAEALNIIQAGKRKSANMALVCMNPEVAIKALKNKRAIPPEAGVVGIITLENVLEELIQEQIYDEKDKKMNPSLERAKWAVAKWKIFTLKKRVEREQAEYDSDDDPFNYREIV
jgi:metal transporter CNNM